MSDESQQPPPHRRQPPPHRRRAVALRYKTDEDSAPRVVAKGQGHLAERIIALAQEHGVHVHEDRDLVALLAQLDVDADIPEDLYRAVAEVLAFVYRLNQRVGASAPEPKGPRSR